MGGRKFSGTATLELNAEAAKYLAAAEAWLNEHEPAQLRLRGPGQVIDSALQGLANAESARSGQDGFPMVCALAHQAALIIIQQPDRREAAIARFLTLILTQLSELDADMKTQGSA